MLAKAPELCQLAPCGTPPHGTSPGQHRNFIWQFYQNLPNLASQAISVSVQHGLGHMHTLPMFIENSSQMSEMRRSHRPAGSCLAPASVAPVSKNPWGQRQKGEASRAQGWECCLEPQVPALHCGSLYSEACGCQGLWLGSVLDERSELFTSVGACYSCTYPMQVCL